MGRVIRLKEWGCGVRAVKRPSGMKIGMATSALEDKNYALNTDKNGFIINSATIDDAKRKKSMVLLGDSFVESLFVDEGARMNSVIERFSPDLRVLNGGYSGATSLHLVNVIVNKVIPLSPSYVVFFVPTNDQRVKNMNNGYWNKDRRLSPLVETIKGSELIDQYPEIPYAKSVEKLLKVVHFLLRNFAIPHCFATTPHRQNVACDDEWLRKADVNEKSYFQKVKSRKNINAICRSFCETRRISCIDLEAELSAKNEYFYDDLHLNTQGSLVVGEIVSKQLESFGVI